MKNLFAFDIREMCYTTKAILAFLNEHKNVIFIQEIARLKTFMHIAVCYGMSLVERHFRNPRWIVKLLLKLHLRK